MLRLIDRSVEMVLALLMAAIVTLIFIAVFFRFVVVDPITWAEEVARFCIVWVSFLGTYVAHRRGEHIAVTTVADALPPRLRALLMIALRLLLLAFMAVLVWYGSEYAVRFMMSLSPLLDIPLGLVYAAMPTSAALIVLSILVDSAADLRRWFAAKAPEI